MIDGEHGLELHVACKTICEIFNDIFNILIQQQKEINDLKNEVQNRVA
jgi:hypothetical protein